jgi:MoaD family protein
MNVHMQYFAQVRQAAGTERETLTLAEGADVRALLARLDERHGEAFRAFVLDASGNARPGIILLVNDQPVDRAGSPRLADGDRVSIFSPVAGG